VDDFDKIWIFLKKEKVQNNNDSVLTFFNLDTKAQIALEEKCKKVKHHLHELKIKF
jgi:hypothetical protein